MHILGYLCEFSDLVIVTAQLDEIMDDAHNPLKAHIVNIDTKSLRDTHVLLDTVPIAEVIASWRHLSSAALTVTAVAPTGVPVRVG